MAAMIPAKLFPTKFIKLRTSSMDRRKKLYNLYFGLTGATSLIWGIDLSFSASLVVSSLISGTRGSPPDGTDVLGGDKVLVRPFDSSDKIRYITRTYQIGVRQNEERRQPEMLKHKICKKERLTRKHKQHHLAICKKTCQQNKPSTSCSIRPYKQATIIASRNLAFHYSLVMPHTVQHVDFEVWWSLHYLISISLIQNYPHLPTWQKEVFLVPQLNWFNQFHCTMGQWHTLPTSNPPKIIQVIKIKGNMNRCWPAM